MKPNPILEAYKRILFINMMHQSKIREPERHYNYIINILNILGCQEIRQNNINFNVLQELINYSVEFLEDNFILSNELINILM